VIRVAQDGLVPAKWTDQILDETFESIVKQHPGLDPVKLARTRDLMGGAIRDCLVTGYEPFINVVTLPDPDDRHVLAAAIKARAPSSVSRTAGRTARNSERCPGQARTNRPGRDGCTTAAPGESGLAMSSREGA
jgi:hypothetical protein